MVSMLDSLEHCVVNTRTLNCMSCGLFLHDIGPIFIVGTENRPKVKAIDFIAEHLHKPFHTSFHWFVGHKVSKTCVSLRAVHKHIRYISIGFRTHCYYHWLNCVYHVCCNTKWRVTAIIMDFIRWITYKYRYAFRQAAKSMFGLFEAKKKLPKDANYIKCWCLCFYIFFIVTVKTLFSFA